MIVKPGVKSVYTWKNGENGRVSSYLKKSVISKKRCLTNPCLFTSEIIEGYFEGIVHKSRVSTDQTFRREF